LPSISVFLNQLSAEKLKGILDKGDIGINRLMKKPPKDVIRPALAPRE
jgi:hypothetical protein